MAILIVEHNGNIEGARLDGRILIGRRENNHVVVDDPAVSRIHAWIDTADRQFRLTDAGSRTGTFVNGQRVAGNVALHHGDQIKIGPASMTFRSDASLPAGVSQLDFGDRAAAAASDGGILFDCTCGAPLWISSAFAGRLGKCRFCGPVVRVPKRPGAIAVAVAEKITTPAESAVTSTVATAAAASTGGGGGGGGRSSSFAAPAASAAALEFCGVCQSQIEPGESSTRCPSCGLTFHIDCWTENLGCSAYGCSQVNVLAPPTAEAGELDETPTDAAVPLEVIEAGANGSASASANGAQDPALQPKIPPGHALLAASVASVLFGALTFGMPALAVLIACFIYVVRLVRAMRAPAGPYGERPKLRLPRIPRVLLAAMLLAAVGVVAGVIVSYFWWLEDAIPHSRGVLDVHEPQPSSTLIAPAAAGRSPCRPNSPVAPQTAKPAAHR
jgi:hypothetical protein